MVFFCALLAGCGSKSSSTPVRISGKTMGTFYDVRFDKLPEGESEKSVQQKIETELNRINDLMSTWKPDSQLMQFNNSTSTDWYPVDPDVSKVVGHAIKMSWVTEGRFDVTVGPLVELWNFGVPKEDFHVPTDEELAAIKDRIGWQLVTTRKIQPALKKSHPQVFLNLSAIAKGFAVDQVGAVLEQTGIHNYLVNIGGEMSSRGKKANGELWSVAIEQPTSTADAAPSVLKALPLENMALATSGNYRNFYEDASGNRYSHTIDPRTEKPVTHHLLSASVLAQDCMQADALATGLMVMGPEEAQRMGEERDLAIFLVFRTSEEGSQIEWASPRFEKYLREHDVKVD
ncbi:MAG: FAD:protein FMN transferase [Planctomycetaceae bacterium]|nr:FAD:protein FMN transferase [Planctomycetaceae bacterium]